MSWRSVKFGDVLVPNRRPYELGPAEDADLVGMRWYGFGPFHRERKPAIRIQKKSHFVIRSGDIIYNKLFAWKGAFGIVTDDLDGMLVSDKFPTYELDEHQVHKSYLRWYFRCPLLWAEARRRSKGSAALSKFTLNPPKFLELPLPLPKLSQQRELAEKIAGLMTLTDEALRLHRTIVNSLNSVLLRFLDELYTKFSREYDSFELNELVIPQRGISYGIVKTGQPTLGGIRTFRAGDISPFALKLGGLKEVDPEIEEMHRRTRLEGNELLLRIRGGLGELAVVPKQAAGYNVSREIAVIPFVGSVNPHYAMFILSSSSVQRHMITKNKGTSYKGINLKDVKRIRLPLPPRTMQDEIVENCVRLLGTSEKAKQTHASRGKLLDGLPNSVLLTVFSNQCDWGLWGR